MNKYFVRYSYITEKPAVLFAVDRNPLPYAEHPCRTDQNNISISDSVQKTELANVSVSLTIISRGKVICMLFPLHCRPQTQVYHLVHTLSTQQLMLH